MPHLCRVSRQTGQNWDQVTCKVYSILAFTITADCTCNSNVSCMTFRILSGGQRVSGSKARVTTEDNPAYGVIGPNGSPYIQPPPAAQKKT